MGNFEHFLHHEIFCDMPVRGRGCKKRWSSSPRQKMFPSTVTPYCRKFTFQIFLRTSLFNIFSSQVTVTEGGSLVSAAGGYFLLGGRRVYPGQATSLWNGGWGDWTQEKDEEDFSNQRASFMTARVSPDFVNSFCFTSGS